MTSPTRTPPKTKLTPATVAGQAVAFLVCALAAGLLAAWLGQPVVFVGSIVALGAGVSVGLTTGIGLRFTLVAGWVIAVAATLATMLVVGLLETYGHVDVPYALSPLVGLFVVGLDWCYVSRLRGAIVLSGVLVVPLLAGGKGWETAAALVWFGGALLAFWFLERDARSSVPGPEPVLGGDQASRRPTSLVDLLGVIGPALLVGLAAAMLIGNPSCSKPSGTTDLGSGIRSAQSDVNGTGQGSGQEAGQGVQQGSGRSSASQSSSSGEQPSPTGESAPLYRLDRDGREQTVDGYGSGGGTITDGSGQQYTVSSEGGQTVVRDANGAVVARLDRDEVVASSSDGDSQHYQIDGEGRVFVLGADGQRYDVDERGGQVVLVGPDGQIVASAPVGADHLYARDANGDTLVPGGRDDGIPIPSQAVLEGLLGQGRTYGTGPSGDPVVTGPDGSTRQYGTDAQGRPQVRVDDGHGTVRTYVYEQSNGHLDVLELDQDGNQLHRFRVDPQGTYVEGRTASGSGGQQATALADAGQAGAPTEVAGDDGPNWWLIAGLALAVLAFVGAVWWWLRGLKPPPELSWADAMARRIEREGSRRGRPRATGETIVAYAAALAGAGQGDGGGGGELADPRLTTIGRVVSDALFGRHEPSAELRAWADESLTEIVDAHPVPRWTDRFRRSAPRSAAT